MEIYINDNYADEEKIIDGKSQYLEDLSHSEKPSFFICMTGKNGKEYEIHFHFDSVEELDNHIKELENLKNPQ
jgi:hypothetical protein